MSEWKEGAAQRRDARNIKTEADPKPKAANAKKDTKKWCKGKVGVEHTPKCRDYSEVKGIAEDYRGFKVKRYAGWKLLVCTECGKELATYYGNLRGERRAPPAWVTETT